MMRWMVSKSLAARRAIVGASALLVVFGLYQFRNTAVDVVPEFTPPTVQIQTEALGLSAAEVEQLITVPLEQDLLNGVAWLDTIRSQSVPGLSSIELIFEPGTPIVRARQVVQERLTQAHALPNVSKPPQMIQPLSSTSRVMMVGLSSQRLSAIELSVLARWTVRPKLMGVPGVANVAIFGQRERQLQVQVDPERLRQSNVTLDEIVRTTGNALWVSPLTFLEASTPGTGGFIDTPNQRLGVQHLSPIDSAEDLAKVVVERKVAGPTLRLGDVATVVEDHQPLIGDAIFVDNPGVLLVIEKFPGESTVDVTHRIDEAFAALRPGLTGVDIDPFLFRPAVYIDEAVDNLTVALAIGLVLAGLALLGLFFDWRRALVAGISVVVAAFIVGLVLYLRDEPVNAMILAGLVLAIALAVDDAVMTTTNVSRRVAAKAAGESGELVVASNGFTLRLRHFRKSGSGSGSGNGNGNGHRGRALSAPDLIRDAVVSTVSPLLFALAIIGLTVVPMFFMSGLTGDSFFPPLALSYLLAAVASLAVTLSLIPALASILGIGTTSSKRNKRAAAILEQAHDRFVAPTVRRRIAAPAVFAVLLISGLAVFSSFDASALPVFRDSNLLIQWHAAPGTSLPEMQRITAQANAELRLIPGVVRVGSHVGRAITSDQVSNVSDGEIWVRLSQSADYERALEQIDTVLSGYPGIRHETLTYTAKRLRDVLTTDGAQIDLRIYGEDPAILNEKAEEILAELNGIRGAADPRIVSGAPEPSLSIEVDLDNAQDAGIKPGDVRRAAATLLAGLEVGALFQDQKVYEVIVRGTPETRSSLTSVENLVLDTPGGDHVRLGDVANVKLAATSTVIDREASQRIIDVTANVDGRSVGAVESDLQDALERIEFPLGYHAELVDTYQERQDDKQRVAIVALLATLGVLLVYQAAFTSWRLAVGALLVLPVAVTGGLVTALIDDRTLTIGSVAGLIGILGISARHTLAMVRRYQQLRRERPTSDRADLANQASREQVVPVVFSVVVTAAALLPVLLLGSRPGSEIIRPLAVVMFGGLVTVIATDFYLLPAICARLGPRVAPNEDVVDLRQPEPSTAPSTLTTTGVSQ